MVAFTAHGQGHQWEKVDAEKRVCQRLRKGGCEKMQLPINFITDGWVTLGQILFFNEWDAKLIKTDCHS